MSFDFIDDKPEQYNMITEQLAVGSLYSSYDGFDVIVNMAYRYDGDGFRRHQMTTSIEGKKTIIRIGIHDTPSEPLDKILPHIIPVLLIAIQDGKRILVHCQAGMSRSASVAIALLSKYDTLSYEEALQLVKSKRPICQPNEGFSKMLEAYCKTIL